MDVWKRAKEWQSEIEIIATITTNPITPTNIKYLCAWNVSRQQRFDGQCSEIKLIIIIHYEKYVGVSARVCVYACSFFACNIKTYIRLWWIENRNRNRKFSNFLIGLVMNCASFIIIRTTIFLVDRSPESRVRLHSLLSNLRIYTLETIIMVISVVCIFSSIFIFLDF